MHRRNELIALTLLGMGVLGLAAFMIYMDHMGEAFATLFIGFGSIITRIGQLGQSQVMNAMADHLANSTPARKDD